MTGATPAERMREHRLLFERAVRDRLSLRDAQTAAARERWERATGLTVLPANRRDACGTAAQPQQTDTAEQRSPLWWLNY